MLLPYPPKTLFKPTKENDIRISSTCSEILSLCVALVNRDFDDESEDAIDMALMYLLNYGIFEKKLSKEIDFIIKHNPVQPFLKEALTEFLISDLNTYSTYAPLHGCNNNKQYWGITTGTNRTYQTFLLMHFDGCLHRAETIEQLDINSYKKLRCASTLSQIKSVDDEASKKYMIVALMAHSLSRYLTLIETTIRSAGYDIDFKKVYKKTPDCHVKLLMLHNYVIEQQEAGELRAAGINRTIQQSRSSFISGWVLDKKKVPAISRALTKIASIAGIGTDACSKREFAMICQILTGLEKYWKAKSLAQCQEMFAMYCGVQPTKYKLNKLVKSNFGEQTLDEYLETSNGALISQEINNLRKEFSNGES